MKISHLAFAASTFFVLLLKAIYDQDVSSFYLFVSYCTAFALLLRLARRWYRVVAFPFLLFSALITPYYALTGAEYSYNVVSSLLESNYEESLEFAKSVFFLKYLFLSFVILTIPYVLAALPFFRHSIVRYGKHILTISVFGFVLFFASIDRVRQVSHSTGLLGYYPVKQIILTKKSLFESAFVIDAYAMADFTFDVDREVTNDVSVVLIIGESARKISMGVYDYEFRTTPHLSALKANQSERIVALPNATAVAPFTRVSVPSMMSLSNVHDFRNLANFPSIFKLLNAASIDTIFASKEKGNTFHDALINEMVKDNSMMHVVSGEYDISLVELLKRITSPNSSNSKLITLQLSGSHYRYKDRYPKSYGCFYPDSPEANYLNSLHYTDTVLKEAFNHVDSLDRPYVILYVSDHGEYVNDDGDGIYGHGYKRMTRAEIEIPLVFLFNRKFLERQREKAALLKSRQLAKVSHDEISHTVLGLFGTTDPIHYDATYDLTSEEYRERKRFVINRDMELLELTEYSFATVSRPSKLQIKTNC